MKYSLINICKIPQRFITLHPYLCKQSRNKRIVYKSDSDSSSRSSKALDLRGKKNRELWQQTIDKEDKMLGKVSTDDVFFIKNFETVKYSVEEAIENFKDTCLERTLLNSPNSILSAKLLLNMRTKKQGRFIFQLFGLLNFPHSLQFLPERKVVAFCNTPENASKALENGAFMAGGEELVTNFAKGSVNYEEFDCVICQEELLSQMKKIKLVLRDKIPMSSSNMRQVFGEDDELGELVRLNREGVEIKSRKMEGIPEEAILDVPFGIINWSSQHLSDNFNTLIRLILDISSPQITGQQIRRCQLVCPPSDEVFNIDISQIMEEHKRSMEKKPKQRIKDKTKVEQDIEVTSAEV